MGISALNNQNFENIKAVFGIRSSDADVITVKPVYNDHLMEYFSSIWSSSRWPRAT